MTTTAHRAIPDTAVLDTLADGSGLTAAEVAHRAGIGRSTAQRILNRLVTDGQARREPGGRDGGRRLPDRWYPASATTTSTSGRARLGKGQLATMVRDYITAHPGADLSPRQIARALGDRSPGAVGNALDRLARRGEVTQSSHQPLRYCADT